MADCERVLQVQCAGKPEDIRYTLQDLDKYLRKCSIPCERVEDLNLVLAEVMTNIARHSYPQQSGVIDVKLVRTEEALECHIMDCGVTFDPSRLGWSAPDPGEFHEGGYGWYIIRNLTHRIRYERLGDRNLLYFSISLKTRH